MQTFDPAGLAAIDDLVAAAVAEEQVPGAVVGVACGDSVHVAVAGAMTIGGPPMTRDALFRIASITKPMTAATVLALVADGVLDLDDPVDRWIPELSDRKVLRRPDGPLDDTEAAARDVTVRDLLTFTWGFGMDGAMFAAAEPWPVVAAAADLHTFGPPTPASLPDPDTWIAQLGELPLIAQPGAKWLYSSGSQVLGVLAGRVGRAGFAELMSERLFAPLGMDDTGFSTTDTTRLPTAYGRRSGGEALEVVDPPDGEWSRPPAFADGAAGLLSTVDDVLRFGRMLLRDGDPVLPAALVRAMTANQLTPQQAANDWGGFSFLDDRGWGYGMSVLADRYSWDGGSGCAWSNVPSLDLTVVTLTQREVDHTGPPAVWDTVLDAARAAVR